MTQCPGCTKEQKCRVAWKMCGGKRLYVTKKEAVHSVAKHLRRFGVAMRIYKCPLCKGYHLTRARGE